MMIRRSRTEIKHLTPDIRRLGRSVEISELLPGRKHEGLKEDTYTRCFSKNLSLSILGLGSFVSFLMYFLTSQLWHFKKKNKQILLSCHDSQEMNLGKELRESKEANVLIQEKIFPCLLNGILAMICWVVVSNIFYVHPIWGR